MPRKRSPNAHGPSEAWDRPGVVRLYERERRRLARRLRALRDARGYTQEEAAERAGLTPRQVGRAERAQTNVSLVGLAALAHAYGVTVRALFEE